MAGDAHSEPQASNDLLAASGQLTDAHVQIGDTGAETANPNEEPLPEPTAQCNHSSSCQKNTPTQPFCHLGTGQCVQCLTDFHCGDGQACSDEFKCRDPSCTPNWVSCDGPFLTTCNAEGNGWTVVKCPQEEPFCHQGQCLYCQPGQQFCQPVSAGEIKSKAVVLCSADGATAQIVATCGPNQYCNMNKYLQVACMTCVPGDKQCQEDKAMVCDDDGASWSVLQDCARSVSEYSDSLLAPSG